MLLLTSTTDKLQVVTGSAGTIDVHASWMDNVAGAVAPGRTNTNISAGTTTDVVGSPGASTQRNIKTLHVRNRGAASCDITVQHTDGTTVSQLHKTAIRPGETLQYIDEIGFFGVVGQSNAGLTMNVQTFTASGTYTPSAGTVYAIIECVGGGGGGGGSSYTGGNLYYNAAGGGSGGYSRKFVSVAALGTSQVVTIGTGGNGGTAGGTAGGDGAATSVGSICVANGGKGGGGYHPSSFAGQAGAGGSIVGAIGDIVAAGAPGGGVTNSAGPSLPQPGGSSHFGGGAVGAGPYISTGLPGLNAGNYGGGGSGGHSITVAQAGGAGSSGIVIITEFIGTLGPALPTNSPVLTGDPQTPTAAQGDNDNSIASTQFVQQNSARVLLATLAPSGVAQIDTPNGIFTSTYDFFEIDYWFQHTGSGDTSFLARASYYNGGSYDSSAAYYYHLVYSNVSSPYTSAGGSSTNTSLYFGGVATGNTAAPAVAGSGRVRAVRPWKNGIFHHFSFEGEGYSSTANFMQNRGVATTPSGNLPITNLRFFLGDGTNFIAGSFIKIYGIR